MIKAKPKVIVIVGPTSSGKSGVAIELAKKINGEIISADSRQIFQGMDIGTGKVKNDFTGISNFEFPISKHNEEFFSEGIRHHLIDVAEPMEDFNISHFKTQAEEKIRQILKEKKIPIICGGSNFWISALTENIIIPEVAPDNKLREKLEKKNLAELFSMLEKMDSERAKNIDSKNKVRLIRAIEICKKLGKVPSQSSAIVNPSSKYEFLQIGISTEREDLNAKIKKRLEQRFEEGMLEEVEKLNKMGVSWEWLERIGLEYRWISRFLKKEVGMEEMQEKLYFDIIHYAKRQMTWLRKNKQIIWLKNYQEIEKQVLEFLKK